MACIMHACISPAGAALALSTYRGPRLVEQTRLRPKLRC